MWCDSLRVEKPTHFEPQNRNGAFFDLMHTHPYFILEESAKYLFLSMNKIRSNKITRLPYETAECKLKRKRK